MKWFEISYEVSNELVLRNIQVKKANAKNKFINRVNYG